MVMTPQCPVHSHPRLSPFRSPPPPPEPNSSAPLALRSPIPASSPSSASPAPGVDQETLLCALRVATEDAVSAQSENAALKVKMRTLLEERDREWKIKVAEERQRLARVLESISFVTQEERLRQAVTREKEQEIVEEQINLIASKCTSQVTDMRGRVLELARRAQEALAIRDHALMLHPQQTQQQQLHPQQHQLVQQQQHQLHEALPRYQELLSQPVLEEKEDPSTAHHKHMLQKQERALLQLQREVERRIVEERERMSAKSSSLSTSMPSMGKGAPPSRQLDVHLSGTTLPSYPPTALQELARRQQSKMINETIERHLSTQSPLEEATPPSSPPRRHPSASSSSSVVQQGLEHLLHHQAKLRNTGRPRRK